MTADSPQIRSARSFEPGLTSGVRRTVTRLDGGFRVLIGAVQVSRPAPCGLLVLSRPVRCPQRRRTL